MSYCPKCGIEIDNNIEKCPLCEISIPKVDVKDNKTVDRFPKQKNVYPEIKKRIKKRIFRIVTMVMIINILSIIYDDGFVLNNIENIKYSLVSGFATWVYLFFLFGFVPNFKKSVIGISVNTLILLFFLDIFNGKLDWFQFIGVPAVMIALIITLFIYYVSKKVKRKGTNVAGYTLLGIVIYCIGLELSINMYLRRSLYLIWSIDVAFEIVPIAIFLLYLHYGFPKSPKRKFHI